MSLHFLSSITGSFSQGAAENPTVAMIEDAYKDLGINWRYVNCEVSPSNLSDAVKGAKAMNWKGFNCSVPHKVAIIEHLDGLGDSAKLIGAVNTVVERNGLYIGENTDGKGFLTGLTDILDIKGKRVLILGAGGAARAISVELALAGVKSIGIVNRNVDRGRDLVSLLNQNTSAKAYFIQWDHTVAVEQNIDILVNSTTIGLYPRTDQHVNINLSLVGSHTVVADVIPNPPETNLLKAAKEKGCQTINGLEMLVNQGRLGIRYWTGLEANTDVMKTCLNTIFA